MGSSQSALVPGALAEWRSGFFKKNPTVYSKEKRERSSKEFIFLLYNHHVTLAAGSAAGLRLQQQLHCCCMPNLCCPV